MPRTTFHTLEFYPIVLPQVSALVDPTGTGNITVVPVLSNLDRPNGVAWHNSSLFVAEVTTISRFDDVDSYALAGRVSAVCHSAQHTVCHQWHA